MSAKSTGASRLSDLSKGRKDVLRIPPRSIVIDPDWNYRNYKTPENKQHLRDTRASIAANGVKNPLWVRFDEERKVPVLVAGETRLKSVLDILDDPMEDQETKDRLETIPVIQQTGKPRALLILSLLENAQKPPSQLEAGAAFRRLMQPEGEDAGMTVEEIATTLGYTKKFVEDALKLDAEATPAMKKLISEMAVTPSRALYEIKTRGSKATAYLEAAVRTAKQAVEERNKAKEAKKAAEKKNKGGRPPKKDKPVKLARPKAAGGKFIKDSVLKVVISALKAAAKVKDDVDVSMTAETALESLQEAMKGKKD